MLRFYCHMDEFLDDFAQTSYLGKFKYVFFGFKRIFENFQFLVHFSVDSLVKVL